MIIYALFNAKVFAQVLRRDPAPRSTIRLLTNFEEPSQRWASLAVSRLAKKLWRYFRLFIALY